MSLLQIPDIANDPAWKPVEPFEVECFYPGTHRGDEWSDEMNQQMCDNYNNLPEDITWRAQTSIEDPDDAPFGETDIGHDGRALKTRQRPSTGVIDRMKYVGGRVIAVLSNVPKLVKDCYDRGIYPNVSLTIYKDGQNEFGMTGPVPRGLSFLGAEPNQLKGLRRALDLMSDRGEDITTIPGVTFADAQVGANPTNNTETVIITFATKGQVMPEIEEDVAVGEEELAPAAEPELEEEAAAPEDVETRMTALEAKVDELIATIAGALEEEEPVATEEGPERAQGEFAEYINSVETRISSLESKNASATKSSKVNAKIAELKGKGLTVDTIKIRKYAEKIDDNDALMAFCEACSPKVRVPGKTALKYSEAGSGVAKDVEGIIAEMFAEHPNATVEHADKYARKYGVPRETLLK